MSIMHKIASIIVFLLLAISTMKAQNNFSLHLDKSFYVTGEEIWYKLYLPVGFEQSLAIKGIVMGPNGNVKERFFLRSIPGQPFVTGAFKIPFDYVSGIHRLAFLASAEPDQPELELVKIDIPIYNDFEIKSLAEKLQNKETPSDWQSENTELSGLKIFVQLNKTEFNRREAVNAEIMVTDAAGNPVEASLSVVARDENLVNTALPGATNFASGPILNATQMRQLSDKIFVKGMVMDTFNNPTQANVLGGYASVQKRIHYGKSNPQGFFTFFLPDFYGEQTLQFISYPKENDEIRVRLLSEAEIEGRPAGKLPVNEKILQYLEGAQQKKKMAEYFEYLNENQDLERVENDFETLKADFTYVADEYVKFETVGDFFSELITPLKFRVVNGKYEAKMENPRSRDASFSNLPGKPLFIIDGKITRNADFIARSSWSNVRSVDIFYIAEKLRKQFNILAQGGVVRIETKIPQFALPPNELEDVFSVNGLVPGSTFVPFEPGNSSAEVRLPHFLMPAFWSPDLKTGSDGKAKVTFNQGDDTSEFVLEIIAQGPNGERGRGTITYTVK